MPTELSKKQVEICSQIDQLLRQRRMTGDATPERPMPCSEICYRLKFDNGIDASDMDIRSVVNYLRRHKTPIASNGDGYFMAQNPRELAETIERMRSMTMGINSAIAGLNGAFDHEAELF